MTAKKKAAGSKVSTIAKSNGNTLEPKVALNKALSGMSVEEIEQQLEARKTNEVTELETRLAKLRVESDTVEQRIAALCGTVVRTRRAGGGKGSRGPRATNERPLAAYLHEILKDAKKPMTARELETALGETDYKSNSKNKYVVIFTALTKNKEMFRKVERGTYEAI